MVLHRLKKYYYKKCFKCSPRILQKHKIHKKKKNKGVMLQCCGCYKICKKWYNFKDLKRIEKQVTNPIIFIPFDKRVADKFFYLKKETLRNNNGMMRTLIKQYKEVE